MRAIPLLGLMEPRSLRSVRGAGELLHEPPDVAWIQKRLTPGHIRIAHAVKERGGLVVYDCDESGPDLDVWAEPALVREMLRLAHVVTTDTPERGELLREVVPSCRTEVLENQVDCADRLPATGLPRARADSGELRVLWFGYGENLGSLGAYVDVLYSLGGVRMVLCGPRRSDIRRVFGRLPVERHRWSRTGFVEVIRSCHVTLLSHFGSRYDAAKSAHKLVTSICHGVPALVSATPDYGRVAALAGITGDAVFDSPEDLRVRLERMKIAETRQRYLERARPLLLARYGAGSFPAAAARLLHRAGRPQAN
ncbi:MAG TPA: hypothetical protein VLH75_05835 [Longimicrobiales bacterium]|nr:hypothetical protein [Longimicrobiales bacterium]